MSDAQLRGTAVALTGIAFFVSGASALVYQVAWQRILALHSGVGIYSVAMITAAFMAGLGLGSHVGGVLSARVSPRAALRTFAGLELGVGAFAALSCWLYYDLLYLKGSWLYTAAWQAGLLHFLALVVPTGLMGMTLPFLVRAMVREADTAGRTVGTLYGINVLGASLGALITPWVLIRFWGIRGAVQAGVLGNAFAALGALAVGSFFFEERAPRPREASAPPGAGATRNEPPASRPFGLWLALYALSGFCALSLEILWFRMIDVGVKATAFTFGTVLAIYLLGLAAGSLIGARVVDGIRRPLQAFVVCQGLLLTYAAAAVLLIARLPPDLAPFDWFFRYWQDPVGFKLGRASDPAALVRLYLLWPAALYGPPTVLMGLSFSILQRAIHDDPRTSGRKVGLLQAANIAGCMAGSLLVGLVSLTWLGTTGTLRILMGCGALFIAVGLLYYGPRWSLAVSGAALAALALVVPSQERLWLRLHGRAGGGGLVDEDATGVVGLTPQAGWTWRLWINGRGLSWLPFGGIHSTLGAVPAIIHPSPSDVAIIGLGSGDTAWAAGCRGETRSITVFEICAPQERLLRRLAAIEHPRGLRRLLEDPRVRMIVADGRNALGREAKSYDLIEADALVPESAYSGNLYSLEFFRLASQRLKPGGIMCTWVPTPRVYATFCKAFPYVLDLDGGRILVGGSRPLSIDVPAWTARLASSRVSAYLGQQIGEDVRGILESCKPPAPEAVGELAPNLDLFPRDEFASPR